MARTTSTPSVGEHDDDLADLFWVVARRLRHHAGDVMSRWDLHPSQARALRTLGHHDVLRPGELARKLRIAPRSATEVVDDLEQRGMVERRPDPADRRAVLVGLTAHGREVLHAWRTERRSEAERFFGALPVDDRVELTRILRTLTESSDD
jgi:DNA-binding MarR family transcriptional regulator